MPTVQFRDWNDFRAAGLEPLTGEADGLSMRLLIDLSERGRKLVCKWLGVPEAGGNKLADNWNHRSSIGEHVASVMLSSDVLPSLSVFAALESPGVVECYTVYDKGEWRGTYGFNKVAKEAHLEEWLAFERRDGRNVRRYAYDGTAGDRNRHEMSGRVG